MFLGAHFLRLTAIAVVHLTVSTNQTPNRKLSKPSPKPQTSSGKSSIYYQLMFV